MDLVTNLNTILEAFEDKSYAPLEPCSKLPTPVMDSNGVLHGYVCGVCLYFHGWGRRSLYRENTAENENLNMAYSFLSANNCCRCIAYPLYKCRAIGHYGRSYTSPCKVCWNRFRNEHDRK